MTTRSSQGEIKDATLADQGLQRIAWAFPEVRNGPLWARLRVVSAMAHVNGQKVALGTSLEGPLNALLSHFAALGPARPGGTHRLIDVKERNDTGAKFVRP